MAALRSTVIDQGRLHRSRRGCRCVACRPCRCGWTATAARRSSSLRLERHPKIEAVHYPGLPPARSTRWRGGCSLAGFGGMAAFEVVGGVEAGQRFATRSS